MNTYNRQKTIPPKLAQLLKVAVTVSAIVAPLHHATASTDDAEAIRVATELLTETGVFQHLSSATGAILLEAHEDFLICGFSNNQLPGLEERKAFTDMVERHFGESAHQDRATDEFVDRLGTDTLLAAKQWYDTETGQRIAKADADSKAYSEKEFQAVAEEYLSSDAWSDDRQTLLSELVVAMRATRFVSLINGEIMVAVEVSGQCDASAEGFKELSNLLRSVRTDARSIESIMRTDLTLLTATVYRDLSDTDLKNYLAFLKSKTGEKFTAGLLEATRHGISGGLFGIRTERQKKHEAQQQ